MLSLLDTCMETCFLLLLFKMVYMATAGFLCIGSWWNSVHPAQLCGLENAVRDATDIGLSRKWWRSVFGLRNRTSGKSFDVIRNSNTPSWNEKGAVSVEATGFLCVYPWKRLLLLCKNNNNKKVRCFYSASRSNSSSCLDEQHACAAGTVRSGPSFYLLCLSSTVPPLTHGEGSSWLLLFL